MLHRARAVGGDGGRRCRGSRAGKGFARPFIGAGERRGELGMGKLRKARS